MALKPQRSEFLGARPKRTLLLAAVIAVLSVAVYAGLHVFVPGFSDLTRAGIAELAGTRNQPVPVPPGGRVREVDGRRILWAGPELGQEFDITEFRIDADGLHYGIGRESFRALIAPKFVSVADAEQWEYFGDQAGVLTVSINGEIKIYPLFILRAHEVVNDTVGGQPIFAAYCVLAELAAAYDRRLDETHTLTFAVSGYTYADADVWGGEDAFVLWDRETESLWWPPIGKAVSGSLIDVPMRLVDEQQWAQMTWGEARTQFPDALVLDRGQSMDAPTSWPSLDATALSLLRVSEDDLPAQDAIAPYWGDNRSLEAAGHSATTQPSTQPASQSAG